MLDDVMSSVLAPKNKMRNCVKFKNLKVLKINVSVWLIRQLGISWQIFLGFFKVFWIFKMSFDADCFGNFWLGGGFGPVYSIAKITLSWSFLKYKK
jgi:hypothetical protein